MSKALVIAGLILILAGLSWGLLVKLPLFRLPGDIMIEKKNFTFMFPITTMILLSVVLSLIAWFFSRRS
ncbi:MAG: DUF2905 domain-containing protein [Candidatus Omnitrophota bacterium]